MVSKGLKGQIFAIDLSFAFFIICIILTVFISQVWLITNETVSKYEEFEKQKKLLDASELLITTNVGLAKYEENSVKHHELDYEKMNAEIKDKLLLSGYDICISLKKRGSENNLLADCEHSGTKITRFAVCDGELCVLQISAK